MTEQQIRADERRKCAAEIRAMNKANTGHEWVRESLWEKIIERAARAIEKEASAALETSSRRQSRIR